MSRMIHMLAKRTKAKVVLGHDKEVSCSRKVKGCSFF